VRSGLEGGRGLPSESSCALRRVVRLHLAPGAARSSESRGVTNCGWARRVFESQGSGGYEDSRCERSSSGGAELPGESRPAVAVKHPRWWERTRRGSKASKSTKLAERERFRRVRSGQLGSACLRVDVERELEPEGNPGCWARERWVVGETAGLAARGAFQARRWRTAWELVAPKGDPRSLRGEHSEGGAYGRQRHETRPQNSSLPGNR